MAGINATVWVSSANCNVHVWNAGGARLSNTLPNGTIMPDFNDGDNLYTIAEVGGTGRATLSNGNLTSQTHFIDVKGRTQRAWSESRLFQMATYSSRGPDTDNRTKPDVASPGHVVVAPVSHTETFGDSSYTISIIEANGRTFGYMPFGGTSMASPNCAGAVALLLEADSSLTAEEVKQIVIQTANKDSYTGATPNPAYGNGKLYAYSALQEVLRRLVARAPFPESVPLRIYPNPAQDLVHILVPVSKQTAASIFIYDATGRVVSSYSEQLYPTESSAVKLGHLPAGVYSLTVQTPEASWQQKLVITR
jgi:subtilisin family serine protease